MSTLSSAIPRPLHAVFTLFLASVLFIGLVAPHSAEAQGRVLGRAVGAAIVGTAIVCATNPHLCGADGKPRPGVSIPGPYDAVGLNQTQAMWVQSGLQSKGFYLGAIDGAIGPGTRASIRNYQASVGDPITGVLTGPQLNDLVAASSTFAPYQGDPVYMFNADLANDLDRNQVAQLQATLNSLGYNAGPVDGAFGGTTRSAIASYKAAQGLPGAPLATRRLLAYMTGTPAPAASGMQSTGMSDEVEVLVPEPAVQAGGDLTFDLIGITLGMREDAVRSALSAEYGNVFPYETVSAETFGGGDAVTTGSLAVQNNWPEPGSEQILTLYDATRPELGMIAAVRMIQMPESVDQAVFEAQVLPGIIDKYGEVAMFGNGEMWIGGADVRAAARNDPGKLADCGTLQVASIAPASDALGAVWASGGGVTLAPGSLAEISADCGQVASVDFSGSVIRIALWNTSALSTAVVAPEIKF
jgi:peptidoglycan hydrolase-like protein with peptidoglycan-binding domain